MNRLKEMKILIDLGHPAHIHYFKNLIWQMSEKGHEFCLVARDKEVLHQLLNHYQFPFVSRGKGSRSFAGKILYLIKADRIIYREARKFNPDLFLSFASTYAAHVSRLMRKKHIAVDDTEHAKFELMMYPPFTDVILNPVCFSKKFSEKQLFFDGYIELSYLHPRYFSPSADRVRSYGISPEEKYFIVRFVSWSASHDIGQRGLDMATKQHLVRKLEKAGRVLISAESALPPELEKFRIKINPADLHHLIYYSSLYIGEGATTASEAIILGTPAIYINTLDAGTIREQATKYGLVSLRDAGTLMEQLDIQLLPGAKEKARETSGKIIREKIDVTAFLVWFVENYPESEIIMRKNPDYQYRFK